MAKENNTLLIFDFDNTITNGHMHNTFSRGEKSDFNSGAEYAVTDTDIRNFLKDTDGIKNERGLKFVLQFALSRGIEVNIASYTGYPNTVKKVAEDYLGLSEEQAKSISVFGGFPADHDTQLPRLDIRAQQSQVGKNLHICKAIVEYKNNHNGQLPKTVMLVDDSTDNIKKIDEFVESISKREGWLKEDGLNIEDIKKIKFEGIQAPINKNGKVVGDANYLEKVQGFINANSVQEPIYENSREEESPYATINKSTVSLEKEMKTIMSVLIKSGHNSEREVHNAQDLFKKETIEALKKQGYGVSDKDRKEIIVKRSEQIDIQKVQEIIKNASDRIIEGFKASKTAPKENIYQNLQDIQNALKAPEPVHQSASPPVPPKKRKSSDGMIGDGVNKRQDTKDMSSSEAQEKRSRRRGATAYPELEKQVDSMLQNAGELSPSASMLEKSNMTSAHDNMVVGDEGKKYSKKYVLLGNLLAINNFLDTLYSAKDYTDDAWQREKVMKKARKVTYSLFQKEIITELEREGYTAKQEKDEITVSSSEVIYDTKIRNSIITKSLAKATQKMSDNKQKIWDLGNDFQGKELEQEISKLLNADSQEEDINPNSVSEKPLASLVSPGKRRSDSDIAVNGENKKQAYTETISLAQEFKAIKTFFKDCAQKIIDAICNLFKREVATEIGKQGYNVSKQGSSGITVEGNKPINTSEIRRDIVNKSLGQILKNTERIKDLGNNYKGGQLEQEISKLLNADLQKENINSNSIGRHYNNGEPTHQTRKETLNADSQKKDINLSRRPLPPLPPESRMEEVKTEGKTKVIGKS